VSASAGPRAAAPAAPVKADRRWRRTFITLCASQFLAMLAFGMALPFLPLYIEHLGVSSPEAAAGWAGAMTSASGLVLALMAPIWGEIADRRGRKPMVARALFGSGLVVGLMSLVESTTQLFVLRTVQGAVSGTVAASRTLLASVAPAAELGFALGMMQTAQFVGTSAGPLIGGIIADRLGFSTAFLLTAVVQFMAGIAVVTLVHEDFTKPTNAVAKPRFQLRSSLRVVTEVPGMAALIGTLFFVQAGVGAVSPVLALFVDSLAPGQDTAVATLAGLVLGSTAVTSAVAAMFAGRLGDRFGHERLIFVCAVCGGLLYVPQALVTTPWQLLGLRALMGLFDGGLMPSVMATIALRSPVERRGWVFGLTAAATSLGGAVGPAVGAGAAALLGLRASFIFTAVVVTMAGLWAGAAIKPLPRAEAA
jgi:DHA1 family multidrug resistance protein-like MFS transporter